MVRLVFPGRDEACTKQHDPNPQPLLKSQRPVAKVPHGTFTFCRLPHDNLIVLLDGRVMGSPPEAGSQSALAVVIQK
jgi:hypothetical protein